MPTSSVPRQSARPGDRRIIGFAALLAAGIFALDLELPLGIAVSALYGIVILFGLFVDMPAFSFVAALAVTLLTTVGAWLSPPGGDVVYGVVNRGLTLVGIWVTAWLVSRYAHTGRALGRSAKDLADTSFALNQAAIVATTNVKGEITFVNDRFTEISKYSREELLGRDHRIINSGHHSKEFIRDLWQTIANGRIWRGELRNRAKDGSIYWVDTTIVPFLDERGRPYQYMAIRYEITDRKRSEERLREQAALARLGEMAAVVAHEVKNPLAAIKGALQVISGRMPPDARDRAIVGDVIARVDSLNDIVQDLLVFARPREPQLSPVDLAGLIENTAALMGRDPAHASHRIPRGPARSCADGDQMRTVSSICRERGAGLRRQAASRSRSAPTTCRPPSPSPTTVRIPAEVRARIFEPFFTTKHRGTGLGLPTARRAVERHRGTLEVECPPSGGTVVTVTVPMQ
jgi:PAS domain S-box-containing protein